MSVLGLGVYRRISPRQVHFKKIGYNSLLPRRSQLSLTNGHGLHVGGAGFHVTGGKNEVYVKFNLEFEAND